MQKRHLFTVVNLAILVFAAVLWVVDVAAPTAMPDFTFAWVCFIATALWGVSFIVRVFFEKQIMLKKSWTFIGSIFLVAAAVCLISALALPGKLILPILCLAIAVAVLVSSVVLGGKKWDEGDNQKPGYKNYYERKAEEEARKAAEVAAARETVAQEENKDANE